MTLPEPFSNALILTGPTACGKTALSLELAERLDAEIIAMDSMTLYRGMDIGTAKPSAKDRERVRHHLIDVLDPWESANVAWWLREARRACREIEQRGKQVLFVGGTPFYLKAILHGLFEVPAALDPELRQRLENEARVMGPDAFHARLAEIDPISAKRLHPNDVRRIVRAMEVWHSTGKRLSELQQQNWWDDSNRIVRDDNARPQAIVGEIPRCLVIDVPREELYSRINRRIETMFESGWVEEVVRLRNLPQQLSKEASKALGYQEIADFLDGKAKLPEVVETIKLRSRQFAKRQKTWFRSLSGRQLCEAKLTFDVWRRKIL